MKTLGYKYIIFTISENFIVKIRFEDAIRLGYIAVNRSMKTIFVKKTPLTEFSTPIPVSQLYPIVKLL
jgi:hypothetical protein